ncbi:hypothetical protein DFJ43DRAFT_1038455 [Lentinula guzmanii]|uniref:Uncharacterized protein n=1 Tax=Lentinula guzmanii TaxID=2804957 RepID=A0AA38N238_9AGAR|nr:hypothetical protein DFJ43DRAFT_1038455 [Lentinula guzmanii]
MVESDVFPWALYCYAWIYSDDIGGDAVRPNLPEKKFLVLVIAIDWRCLKGGSLPNLGAEANSEYPLQKTHYYHWSSPPPYPSTSPTLPTLPLPEPVVPALARPLAVDQPYLTGRPANNNSSTMRGNQSESWGPKNFFRPNIRPKTAKPKPQEYVTPVRPPAQYHPRPSWAVTMTPVTVWTPQTVYTLHT